MKFDLTDANGEKLSVSLSDITDFNTDGLDNTVIIDSSKANVELVIVDEAGNSFNVADAMQLLDSSNESDKIIAADVTFEATHTGENSNSSCYFSDSMEKDTASWMYPFSKPLLKNHNMMTEPLGRVKDAVFGSSELTDGKDCINVTYRVTDQDAITKFIDGRYKTMSIGGSAGHIQCALCGKDILKDGQVKFCGHWRGNVYNGKKAIWNARDIEYKEGSIVNNPADAWAQVKRITLVKASQGEQNNSQEEDPGVNDSENNILDDINGIIDKAAGVENENPAAQHDDNGNNPEEDGNVKDNNPEENEGEEPNQNDGEGQEKTIEDYKAEIDALNQKISEKDSEITGLNEKVSNLNDEVSSLKTQLSDSNSKVEVLDNDLAVQKDMFVKLAISHRKTMCNAIADNEKAFNKLSDSAYEDRVNELSAKKTSELEDLLKNSRVMTSNPIPNPVGKVGNPGLAGGVAGKKPVGAERNSVIEDDDNESNSSNIKDNKNKSYIEYEKELINSMLK